MRTNGGTMMTNREWIAVMSAPEKFSVKSARHCLDDLYTALPQSKQQGYADKYKEVAAVLTYLAERAGIAWADEGRTLRSLEFGSGMLPQARPDLEWI